MSRARTAVVVVILAGLFATTPVSVANAGRPASDQATATGAQGRRALAQVAFDRAVALFAGVPTPGPRDATLVLLDLARAVPDLPPPAARRARALLARPTDGAGDPFGDGYTVAAEHLCGAEVCVHWVESSPDAVPLADDDLNGTPDYVDTAVAVLEDVWSFEVDRLGYRAPLDDSTSPDPGPGGELDVYLADVGADGFYGYCASDDPNATDPGYAHYDVSMYCVLDDDFRKAQFPGVSGTKALKVTAAHEFFHAVQGAYDAWEDPWLSEGTASWIEDELYDTINDNRQYLVRSPLSRPWVPTDRGGGGHQYGAWIYWRFLSESFNRSIVRDIWEYADGSASGPDEDSLRATRLAIEGRGRVFSATFADFGAWNAWPAARYEEGRAYAVPPLAKRWAVTAANGGVPWTGLTLDHLTNRGIRFTPANGIRRTAELRIVVDGPSAVVGPAATVVLRYENGVVKHFVVPLDAKGRGSRRVPFGEGVVAWADLVLTNASWRTRCWQGTRFSCQGDPRDDDVTFRYGAALIR